MTQFLLPPGFRATDSDDNPLAGGYYRFYSGGTTTPKAVYSDADLSTSLGTQVDLNSSGVPVNGADSPTMIFLSTGDYRVRLYDADDVMLLEYELPGTAEEAAAETETAPIMPVVSKTTTYTVVEADRGKIINADPTGGAFSILLPSAVTVGDNFVVGVRHNGSANYVTIIPNGSQVIRAHRNMTAYSLNGRGETVILACDGADWSVIAHAPHSHRDNGRSWIVLDQINSPPTNPDAGDCYIINATPAGGWSSYSVGDVMEADGNGSWIQNTPEAGWLAFDQDEGVSLVYRDGAWENFESDPGESTLGVLVLQDQQSPGTVGGTATPGAWTNVRLQTTVSNSITGSSLASNVITLPAGTYAIDASKPFNATQGSRIRFKTQTGTSVNILGNVVKAGEIDEGGNADARTGAIATLAGTFTIAATTNFLLQYYVEQSSGTESNTNLGFPQSATGVNEVYATVRIIALDALEGPTGPQGANGADGEHGGVKYEFSASTSGDPGTGKILFNNGTLSSVTQLNISETDANGANLAALINIWDDSTSTTKVIFRIFKIGAPQNIAVFSAASAQTDAGDYRTFTVSYVTHSGSFSGGDELVIAVDIIGTQGSTGPIGLTGPAGPLGSTIFDFSSSTGGGDPGAGALAFNNATLASATAVYIDALNAGGVDVSAWIDTFDSLGTSANRGTLLVALASDPTVTFHLYTVTGTVSGSGYREASITHLSGSGSFSASDELLVGFIPAGPPATGTPNVYVVTDAAYGAVGDGATDDTAAIQAAIDAAIAAGGGDVLFPPKNYLHTGLTITGTTNQGFVRLQGIGGRSINTTAFSSATRGPRLICSDPTADWIYVDAVQSVHIENLGMYFNSVTVSGASVSQANPAVVTATAHGLSNGDRVWCTAVTGMTEINGQVYTVANATTDTFELSGLNSSGFASAGTSVTFQTVAESGHAIYANDGNRLIVRDVYGQYGYNGLTIVGNSRPQVHGVEFINFHGKATCRIQGKISRVISTATFNDCNWFPNNAASEVSSTTNGFEIGAYANSVRTEWTRINKAKYGIRLSEQLATVGGTADVITLTDDQNFWEELRDGACAAFTATATSTSTTPTINLNGIGAKTVKTTAGAALSVGGIASGSTYTIMYSEDDDAWLLDTDGLWFPAYIRFDGCATETCEKDGILANAFTTLVFHQLYCALSDENGIRVPAQAAIPGRPNLIVTDSRVSTNGRHGFFLEACPSVYIANTPIGGNSQETTNTYDGIRVTAPEGFLSVMGCQIGGSTFEFPDVTGKQRYAISFSSAVTDPRFRIVGNNLQGNTTGTILDESTDNSTTRGNKKVQANVGEPDWIDNERIHGTFSPTPALSANTDDWTFSGIGSARLVRISTSGSINLTGIVAQEAGRRLLLANVSSSNTITLVHDATSTAANRFYLPGGVNLPLKPHASVEIFYDGTSSRWRLAESSAADLETIVVSLSDETTPLATGTATATFRMPFAMTLTAVRASLSTAPTGGIVQFDINEGGTSILSTKLTIDASEKTSTTAATPAVISDTSLADDAEMTVDIDTVNGSPAGAKIYLIGYRT